MFNHNQWSSYSYKNNKLQSEVNGRKIVKQEATGKKHWCEVIYVMKKPNN